MSASEHRPTVSVLAEAARHESALMAVVVAADQDAQRIVGQAHEQAAAHLLETQHRTEKDIAQMRHQAASDRARVETAIEEDAAQKVAAIRAKSMPGFEAIKHQVVARILPAGTQIGGASA